MTSSNDRFNADAGASARNIITVIQGEVEISDDPDVTLSTILGSCVAVCMWDERARVGGMNHFLLANGSGGKAVKYGAYAMEVLINKLLRAGAQRSNLQGKLFGGASLSGFARDIGRNNAKFARDFLESEGIICLGESLGGDKPRRVRFDPTTGKAQMLFVRRTDVVDVAPVRAQRASDITLF